MNIASFIKNCKNFDDFVYKTSLLQNKGNWKKGVLAKDTAFEFLTKLIIEKHPLFHKLNIDKVWHESEIPSREKRNINYPKNIGDEGLDFLIKTKDSKYHAVQSKFRSNPKDTLAIGKKSDLGTTFNLVNNICKNIENTYIFATINSSPKKKKLIPDNCIWVLNSFFHQFNKEAKNSKWNSLKQDFKKIDFKEELREPEEFQKTAIVALKKHFQHNSRGSLFLPCGTGKTLISYWFAKEMRYKKILILVPNLTLVSQILNNWVNQDYANNIKQNKWLVVCSDNDVRLNEDPMVLNTKDLPFDTTTNNEKIENFLKKNVNDNIFIISTYNSSHKVCSISKKIKFKFNLCIFDEAHKTVGTKDKIFSTALYEKNINIQNRLFMTATKRVIHGHKDIMDMRNKNIYGSVAHELSFKEAIDNKNPRLCNYKFKALGISKEEILKLWKTNPNVRTKKLDSTTMKYLSGLILLFKIWNKHNLKKGITFHNTIEGSENFKKIAQQYQVYLNKKNDVEFFNISSKKSQSGDKQSIIEDFSNDQKSIITNARCLVEGVDVPAVDVILFSDKKRSRVDIVQAIGRCLRKSGKKKFGYVIVPFIFDKKLKPENLLNSEYKDVIKTIRILSLYDKTFAEDIKLNAKSRNYFKGKVEIDFPTVDHLIDIQKLKDAIKVENFKSIGPLNWLSFEEAKREVQKKRIQTSVEFITKYQNGEFDPDMPSNPNQVYKDEGFTTWGEFLGTGRVSNLNRKELYWKFEKARSYVQKLKLKNQIEWTKFCSTGEKPLEVPSHPHSVYIDEYISLGDWLGTGTIASQDLEFDFIKSREWCHKLTNKYRIKTRDDFKEAITKNKINIPKDVSINPGQFKNEKGYKNEPDFYGWDSKKTINARDFFDARNFIRTLKLTKKQWNLYKVNKLLKFGKKPSDIPASPNKHREYKVHWKGFADWLGTYDFEEADENVLSISGVIKSLGIKPKGIKRSGRYISLLKKHKIKSIGKKNVKGKIEDAYEKNVGHQIIEKEKIILNPNKKVLLNRTQSRKIVGCSTDVFKKIEENDQFDIPGYHWSSTVNIKEPFFKRDEIEKLKKFFDKRKKIQKRCYRESEVVELSQKKSINFGINAESFRKKFDIERIELNLPSGDNEIYYDKKRINEVVKKIIRDKKILLNPKKYIILSDVAKIFDRSYEITSELIEKKEIIPLGTIYSKGTEESPYFDTKKTCIKILEFLKNKMKKTKKRIIYIQNLKKLILTLKISI